MLVRSAEAVHEAYADTDPDLRQAINRGENPIIDISVSFEGTWQKHGFTSLYGIGICIAVLTGYVVDYAVLSKDCHACKMQEAKNQQCGHHRFTPCLLMPVHNINGVQ